MMTSAVLVLNQNYEPLNVCNTRRAFVLVDRGKAEVLEHNEGFIRSALPARRRPGPPSRRPGGPPAPKPPDSTGPNHQRDARRASSRPSWGAAATPGTT